MQASRELRHIARAVPRFLKKPEHLPGDGRALRRTGVPMHAAELIALGSFRLLKERPLTSDDDRPPVLLLHGYAGHPKSLLPLQWALDRRGRRSVRLDLRDASDVFGMAEIVKGWLRERASAERPAPIVAHSLGGLIARLALFDDDIGARVERIITLGTPHEGTRLGDLVDSEVAEALERDSDIKWRLEEQEPWGPHLPKLYCVWSLADLLNVPPHAAIADGAAPIEVEGMTHYGYLVRPSGWRLVAELLDRPRERTVDGRPPERSDGRGAPSSEPGHEGCSTEPHDPPA